MSSGLKVCIFLVFFNKLIAFLDDFLKIRSYLENIFTEVKFQEHIVFSSDYVFTSESSKIPALVRTWESLLFIPQTL